LPFTAPFSTLDAANLINGLTAGTEIGPVTHCAAADDTAIESDRLELFVQSIWGALVTEPSAHALPNRSRSLPVAAPRPGADVPSTTTVLQI
jgi:hypothetical protein